MSDPFFGPIYRIRKNLAFHVNEPWYRDCRITYALTMITVNRAQISYAMLIIARQQLRYALCTSSQSTLFHHPFLVQIALAEPFFSISPTRSPGLVEGGGEGQEYLIISKFIPRLNPTSA